MVRSMSETKRVFISWSGEQAKQIARVLHAWIDSAFDNADPWMSDIDIAGGEVSLPAIGTSLAGSAFGVVVTTKENQGTPWINYEAGALSKVVNDDAARVMPLLVDLRVSDVTSPLKQFQAARLDQEGIGKLIKSLGEVLGLDAKQIETKTEIFWPQLERKLEELPDVSPNDVDQRPSRPEADVLDEILEVVRNLSRTLDTGYVPANTMQRLVARSLGRTEPSHNAWTRDNTGIALWEPRPSTEADIAPAVQRTADKLGIEVRHISAALGGQTLVLVAESTTQKHATELEALLRSLLDLDVHVRLAGRAERHDDRE